MATEQPQSSSSAQQQQQPLQLQGIMPRMSQMTPKSPAALYAEACAQHSVHANVGLMKVLQNTCVTSTLARAEAERDNGSSTAPSELDATPQDVPLRVLRTLDLSTNLVGRIGIRPVLEMVKQTPLFVHLNLSNNYLDSESMKSLVEVLDGAVHIQSIILDGNPIAQLGGRAISVFVLNNPNIVEMSLEDTKLNPGLKRRILDQVESNRQLPEDELRSRLQRNEAMQRDRALLAKRRAEKAEMDALANELLKEQTAAKEEGALLLSNDGDSLADDEATDMVAAQSMARNRPLSIVFAAYHGPQQPERLPPPPPPPRLGSASSNSSNTTSNTTSSGLGGRFNALELLRTVYNEEQGTDGLGTPAMFTPDSTPTCTPERPPAPVEAKATNTAPVA